ncbi:hypothetical protein [Conexibacter woesei]|uniref:Uncharacterized protein n=1 Tax=Conexibacter woesei (strain DSM 14684 / CCUG 47730 / CIP 108061 / JCM 11494 / NBRC 100937 / ID131577) TaxID=469383 RepID=D3FEM7_CONWI|nr:hypothetical protein [Conexibacter woesei]ADB49701.1 hypothetical protein Cwoe_1272 [Conexibacter woesei DSM 14684]
MHVRTALRPAPAASLAIVAALLLAAFALAAVLPSTAGAAVKRAPIVDCGDVSTLDDGGAYLGAVTAQGATCRTARAIAREVAASRACKQDGSCRSKRFTCLLAKAGKELTLVRCENARQTAFVRFEFGA